MASDGVRYFAYLTPKRAVVVLDTFKHETDLIRGARLPAAGCWRLGVLLRCGKIDSDHMGSTKTASARGARSGFSAQQGGYWYSIGRVLG